MGFWPVIVAVISTILIIGIFGDKLDKLETLLTDKFSEATSKRRWFTIWVLVFVLWVALHRMLLGHSSWYTEDVDLITLTGLFSAVPFWVENSLKHGQALFQQMLLDMVEKQTIMLETLTQLTVSVKEALDRDDAKTEAIHALLEELLKKWEVSK